MNRKYYKLLVLIVVLIILLLGASRVIAESVAVGLDGENSQRLQTLSVEGPWILDWSATSEFPLPANFEPHLFNAEAGGPGGTVVQLEGTGRGLKLFEKHY